MAYFILFFHDLMRFNPIFNFVFGLVLFFAVVLGQDETGHTVLVLDDLTLDEAIEKHENIFIMFYVRLTMVGFPF